MRGRPNLLVVMTVIGLAGCGDPEIDRAGTWKPVGINDQNLRAMLANPQDSYIGTASLTSRGDAGSRAVTRLLTDRRRALLDASASHIAPTAAAASDSGPAPIAGGSAGSTP